MSDCPGYLHVVIEIGEIRESLVLTLDKTFISYFPTNVLNTRRINV